MSTPQGKFKLDDIDPTPPSSGRFSTSNITYQPLGDDPLSTISKEAHKFNLQVGSTYRTKAEQQALINQGRTKATNSYHLYGTAADIKGGTPQQRQQFHDYMKNTYGTNLAELIYGTSNHLDHVHVAWNPVKQSDKVVQSTSKKELEWTKPSTVSSNSSYKYGTVQPAQEAIEDTNQLGQKAGSFGTKKSQSQIHKEFIDLARKNITPTGLVPEPKKEGFINSLADNLKIPKVITNAITGNAKEAVSPENWKELGQATLDSATLIPTIMSMGKSQIDLIQRGANNWDNSIPSEANLTRPEVMLPMLAGLIPMIGPQAAHAYDQYESGDITGAIGTVTAIGLQAVLPKIVGKLGKVRGVELGKVSELKPVENMEGVGKYKSEDINTPIVEDNPINVKLGDRLVHLDGYDIKVVGIGDKGISIKKVGQGKHRLMLVTKDSPLYDSITQQTRMASEGLEAEQGKIPQPNQPATLESQPASQPAITEPNPALAAEPQSLGAASPSQFPKDPDIEQLRKTIETDKDNLPKAADYSTKDKLSEKYDDLKESVTYNITKLKDNVATNWQNFKTGVKPINDFIDAVHDWQSKRQENAAYSQRFARDVRKFIPSLLIRRAIGRWVDAGGDATLLQEGVTKSPDIKSRMVYQTALNLPQEFVDIAKNIQSYYDSMLQNGLNEGIIGSQLENYINRLYKPKVANQIISNIQGDIQQGKLPINFSHAKKRIYEHLLDAELKGLKAKTTDIADLIPLYNQEFNDVLAARKFVQDVAQGKTETGEPIIVPAGSGHSYITDAEGNGITIVNPNTKPSSYGKGQNKISINPNDYVPYDHPAFRQQKFVSTDPEGNPVILKADALVHKDFIKEFTSRFDKSSVDKSKIGRGVKEIKNQIKGMLMIGGFHQAHIDVHALQHRIFNPYKGNTKLIDIGDPMEAGISAEVKKARLNTQDALDSGVKIFDSQGAKMFAEGVGSSAWVHKVPVAGEVLQHYTEWLFQQHIPKIKLMYYQNAVARNLSKYSKDITSGKVTDVQIKRLTAEQTNAAFGELNYDVLGTSKTTQDVMGILLLAPDFTRARLQYLKQALQPYGREQRIAMLGGAASMYILARAMNAALNNGEMYEDDPDKMFKVHVGEHWIGIRSVPEDVLNFVEKPGQSIMNRLNPVVNMTKTAIEGTDRFGKKIDPDTKWNRTKEVGSQLSPMFLSPPKKQLGESVSFSSAVERSIIQFLGFTANKYNPNEKVLQRREDIIEREMDRTGLPRKVVERELQKMH